MAELKDSDKPLPECYGRLEIVFAKGPDGLRHVPEDCLGCEVKTECLRSAAAGEQGLSVHEERLERAYEAGAVGFFERWAQQKQIAGRRKKNRGWMGIWKRFRH